MTGYRDFFYSNAASTMIDAYREEDGVRVTLTATDPHTADDFADAERRHALGEIVIVPYQRPQLSLEAARAQINSACQFRIDVGYVGKRVSMASYYTMLERLDRKGKATDEQKADLVILDDASAWEQSVLDAGSAALLAGKSVADIDWPAPPDALAGLAAQC